jgi:peptidoglycan hydrolase-like protein with peptidoglycan-binding domain
MLALAGCGVQPAAQPTNAVPTTTAPVVRTDIVASRQLNGALTYAGAYTVVNQLAGVFTDLPSPGTVVTRGQVIYRVNSRPVVLMFGSPEWRRLAPGATGADVRELELNLLALGFGNSSNLVANGRFDGFDAAAVRRWQASLGEPQTGTVEFGDAVYEPGPIRITNVVASPGEYAQPGEPALAATSTKHVVLVELDVTQQTLVAVGERVTVTMPDGRAVPGTVTAMGTVASEPPDGGQGPATIALEVTLSDPDAGGSLDQAPVIVSVTEAVHSSVLAVPVMALLARPGGTYAVEVVDGPQRRLVPVTLGLFDDRGLVEVASPDLREGMLVEVPVS